MEGKWQTLVFVDRINYDNLQDKNFNNEDIAEICYKDFENISLLTKVFITYLNSELNKLFYLEKSNIGSFDYFKFLTNNEQQYIKDSFKFKFCNKAPQDYIDKKYYEIIVLPNGVLLVVIEEGFLAFLMESKENFLRFILDCLRYQYEFNLSSFLFKTYIHAKMDDRYFDFVKSFFDLG